jgi:TetR/AcrR family transcriptional repressor of nem operon
VARAKGFDPDEVLDRAVDLFWRRGYEATSVQDLVDHLGISRVSLYGTFGDKHTLYLRALDRYEERNGVALACLVDDEQPLAALERVFRAAADDPDRRGCLMVNTATELATLDPAAGEKVAAAMRRAEDGFRATLERARAAGDLPPGRDPAVLARFLVLAYQGVRVLAKAGADPATLDDAVTVALSTLTAR